MPSASELMRREMETQTDNSEHAETYKELRSRANQLGFATVHGALDKLEELTNEQ